MMMIISICWGFICLVVGFITILKMKDEYFKEVITITFLNS